MINEKNFTIILDRVKSFTLKITGFPVIAGLKWLLEISKVVISATIKQTIKKSIIIHIPKVVVTGLLKLMLKIIVLPLVVKKVRITGVLNIIYSFISDIISHLYISTTLKQKIFNFTNITTGIMSLASTVIAEILIYLSALDVQLLSALDTQTLAQLDHV